MPNHPSKWITGKTIALLIGVVLLAIGYCILEFWAKPTLQNARESPLWPTVPGKVIESKVGIHQDDDGTTYSADVLYNYSVKGTEIHSERVWFGDNYSSSNRDQFVQIVNRYPVGSEVKVYYKPNDAFISALEPGTHPSSYVGYAIGWGLMICGAIILLVTLFTRSIFGGEDHSPRLSDTFETP